MNHLRPSGETNREIDAQNERDLLMCYMHIGRGDDRVKPKDFLNPLNQCFARAIIAASPAYGIAPDFITIKTKLSKDSEAIGLTGGVNELDAQLMELRDLLRSEIFCTPANREELAKLVLEASIKRQRTVAIKRLQKADSNGDDTARIQEEIKELGERLDSLTRTPAPIVEEIPQARFPIEALPEPLRSFAGECSRVTGVPIEMAAMCCLAVASASLGSRLRVHSVNGKTTPANIMVLIGAESGTGKSETFRECIAPFKKCADAAKLEWRDQILPRAKAEMKILGKEIKALEGKAGAQGANRESIKDELAEKEKRLAIAELEVNRPVYVASDFTTPELIRILCRMVGQMFTASPDAKNFIDMVLGRYNDGGTDEEVYLKGFSLEPIDRNRVADGSQETAEACITGLWLTQPDKIERLLGERALSEGGLLPRLLMMLIHCKPSRVSMDEHGISEETRTRYESIISELFQAFHNQGNTFFIHPDHEAREALVDYHNAFADRREGDLSAVTSFVARWGEYAWRIALICHAVRHGEHAGDHTLCVDDVQASMAITDWTAKQQLDLLNVGRERAKREKYERVIKLAHRKEEIVARDVYKANITPRDDIALAAALLEEMKTAGHLKSEGRSTGRKNHTQIVYRIP